MAGETTAPTASIWAWRHPRPRGVAGRCIGRTDVPVDPRRAKRLARRIQRAARQHGLPRVVCSSPLRRCADVARWLRRWGWVWRRDVALLELDFGRWDGLPWSAIGHEAVEAWCADFARCAPGGGEALQALLARAAAWQPPASAAAGAVVVGHAGWMLARQWAHSGPAAPPQAAQWPQAPGHGALLRLR